MKKTAVLIVVDERLLAELLARSLAEHSLLKIGGIAGTGEEALRLAAGVRPGLVLLGYELPGMSGLELMAPLRAAAPAARIVVLCGRLNPYVVHQVLRHDADGCVEKRLPYEALARAVTQVLDGASVFSPGFLAVKRKYLDSADAFHKILSDREQEVLRLVATGLSDREIAEACRISVGTVVAHRRNLRRKLDAHSDRDLLAYARQWGLGPKSAAREI